MSNIQIFNNENLKLKVRTIQNGDGSISINAEDTAIGFGWYEEKAGKIYPRWRTINGYIKEFGFSQDVAKDDYIPESLFYMLGMKANNKAAQDFQKWLATEVIPSVRKTGSYQLPKISKELQAIFMIDGKQQRLENEVKDLKDNMPLFNIDCEELQKAVKKKAVKCLGGYNRKAYYDKSLRARVFGDIQREIKRQFEVNSYKAIKRSQLEIAKEIVDKYEVPFVLKDEITLVNNQIAM
ncbi:ORF6C domain-containing protein [uncultured Clostridium sp.]|uniref:ORF6C domain-containing protein n=1 Tax=uncultured Clostridium sp. TaxID=59620 RepID=UPI0028ECED9B|nr:ORF6C domain-containing protein [uncultured Clostridium sp.]